MPSMAEDPDPRPTRARCGENSEQASRISLKSPPDGRAARFSQVPTNVQNAWDTKGSLSTNRTRRARPPAASRLDISIPLPPCTSRADAITGRPNLGEFNRSVGETESVRLMVGSHPTDPPYVPVRWPVFENARTMGWQMEDYTPKIPLGYRCKKTTYVSEPRGTSNQEEGLIRRGRHKHKANRTPRRYRSAGCGRSSGGWRSCTFDSCPCTSLRLHSRTRGSRCNELHECVRKRNTSYFSQ